MVKGQKRINGDNRNQDYIFKKKEIKYFCAFFKGLINLREQESVWYKDLNKYMIVALLYQISLFYRLFTVITRFTGLLAMIINHRYFYL